MQEVKRPQSLTVISRIFFVLSGLSLILSPLHFTRTSTYQFSYTYRITPFIIVIEIIYSAVYVAVGIAILKRFWWGRWLYLIIMPILIAIARYSSTMDMMQIFGLIGSIFIYAVIIFFLFRSKATAYFQGKPFTKKTNQYI
jgi:hypothetical protein